MASSPFAGSNPHSPATQSRYFGALGDFTENIPKFLALARLSSVSGSCLSRISGRNAEFRRPVSVRNFPISVFAAAPKPETRLLSTETGSTMAFIKEALRLVASTETGSLLYGATGVYRRDGISLRHVQNDNAF
jgi:hypothetical protein